MHIRIGRNDTNVLTFALRQYARAQTQLIFQQKFTVHASADIMQVQHRLLNLFKMFTNQKTGVSRSIKFDYRSFIDIVEWSL